MRIETMNISLPRPLKESVQNLVERGGYGNASEYMRELIREDLKRRAKERLDDLLLEGLASGGEVPMTKADWDHLHKQIRVRHAAVQKLKKAPAKKGRARR